MKSYQTFLVNMTIVIQITFQAPKEIHCTEDVLIRRMRREQVVSENEGVMGEGRQV
jgi:hypothetical protein